MLQAHTPPDRPANNERRAGSALRWYLWSVFIWSFDFKPGGGDVLSGTAALVVQLPVLLIYTTLAFAIFKRASALGVRLTPLCLFGFICLLFCLDSSAIGLWNGQALWPIISNLVPIFLFASAGFSTYVVLGSSTNYTGFLTGAKNVCLLFMIVHFLVVLLNLHEFSLSTSRYQILSGASIPALGIFALGIFLRFGIREMLVSLVNLALLLISVTRTYIAIFLAQVLCMFITRPSLVFRPSILRKLFMATALAMVIIGADIEAGSGLTERWIERLTMGSKLGVDPTALTRSAETHFMIDAFTGSFKGFLLGNGLAATTSLTGPDAMLAGSLVGMESIMLHSIGFGHNNHVSLLFTGGLIGGLPLLLLLFFNGLKALRAVKAVLRSDVIDENITYITAWGTVTVIGMLTYGFLGGTFEDRELSLWYGIGTGMVYWGSETVRRLRAERSKLQRGYHRNMIGGFKPVARVAEYMR